MPRDRQNQTCTTILKHIYPNPTSSVCPHSIYTWLNPINDKYSGYENVKFNSVYCLGIVNKINCGKNWF